MPIPPTCPRNSTAVTLAPSLDQTDPYETDGTQLLPCMLITLLRDKRLTNSTPMTPAPIKTRFLGTL